jgi:hypothetical protein
VLRGEVEVARHPLVAPGDRGFLRAAAAAGKPRLASELEAIVSLERSFGADALSSALERATTFRRAPRTSARSSPLGMRHRGPSLR